MKRAPLRPAGPRTWAPPPPTGDAGSVSLLRRNFCFRTSRMAAGTPCSDPAVTRGVSLVHATPIPADLESERTLTSGAPAASAATEDADRRPANTPSLGSFKDRGPLFSTLPSAGSKLNSRPHREPQGDHGSPLTLDPLPLGGLRRLRAVVLKPDSVWNPPPGPRPQRGQSERTPSTPLRTPGFESSPCRL